MILKKWTPGAHLLLKCYLKGKISRKLANGHDIDYSEKKNGPRASSAPAVGLNTIIFKYVYWYMKQISGERLQDHWPSGSYTRRAFNLGYTLQCDCCFKCDIYTEQN